MSNPLAGNFPAVLDACVLWPSSLRDTLLRLAETPQQYIPKWTDQIWKEVANSLERRGRCTPEQTRRLVEAIHAYFPESFVHGYEPLIAVVENDPKDRHVLAAAIRCQTQVIVTSNLRDFKCEVLAPWGVEPQHPDDFLIYLYELDPAVVISKLHVQAANIGRTLAELLRTLRKGVPNFADTIARKLEMDLPEA